MRSREIDLARPLAGIAQCARDQVNLALDQRRQSCLHGQAPLSHLDAQLGGDGTAHVHIETDDLAALRIGETQRLIAGQRGADQRATLLDLAEPVRVCRSGNHPGAGQQQAAHAQLLQVLRNLFHAFPHRMSRIARNNPECHSQQTIATQKPPRSTKKKAARSKRAASGMTCQARWKVFPMASASRA